MTETSRDHKNRGLPPENGCIRRPLGDNERRGVARYLLGRKSGRIERSFVAGHHRRCARRFAVPFTKVSIMRTRFVGLLSAALAASLLAVSNAHAVVHTYQAFMDGPSEAPTPVASPGTGVATVLYDDVANTLTVSASFQGLLGPTSAAHIHATVGNTPPTTAGVAVSPGTLTGFPLGVTSGSMPPTVFDLTLASTYTGTFVTQSGGTIAGAQAALIAAMNNSPAHPTVASRAYFNIHTSAFGGGEIRGFLVRVPEPATIGMAGTMLMGLVAAVRRRRK
jgi:hypothetical protein